jgi:hypothetical protein
MLRACHLSLPRRPVLFALTEASFESPVADASPGARTKASHSSRVAPTASGPAPSVGPVAVAPLSTGGGLSSGFGKDDTGGARPGAITMAVARGIRSPPPRPKGGRGQGGAGAAPAAGNRPLILMDRGTVEGGRGVPRQLFRQFRGLCLEMLRRHHVVLSVFMAHEDAQLPLTLPQRVAVSDRVE